MKLWLPLNKCNLMSRCKCIPLLHLYITVQKVLKMWRWYIWPCQPKIFKTWRLRKFLFKKPGYFSPNQEILKSQKNCSPGYFSRSSVSIFLSRRAFGHFWFISYFILEYILFYSKNVFYGIDDYEDFISNEDCCWTSTNMYAEQHAPRWKQLTLMFLKIISSLMVTK